MGTCKKCRAYLYSDGRNHTCPPLLLALDMENNSDDWADATEVYLYQFEDAATEAADRFDSDCGEGAHERTIHIKDPRTGTIKAFKITFDYSVDYSANEIEQEDKDCICAARQPRADDIEPPEVQLNKNCPVHGVDPDDARDAKIERGRIGL
jgi:hypothetical protein